jgi:EpsI family protein
MGEDLLVPPMMEFTAKSTVWLIQQTGIPVYREGMYFSLPSGHWSVVTACSGVRYIIASVTLGLIYAYLTYRSFSRRFLFMLAAILVPILANTGRAYMIVMLGHWSDMTVAVGVDHLIYGWVFFGVVIFLLFWLGSFFREDGDDSTDDGRASTENEQQERTISANLPAAAFLSLLLAAVWPWLTGAGEARRELSLISITLPDAVSDWSSADDAPWSWRPDNRVASETAGFYVRDGSTIGLYVQYPDGSEDSGEEIVGSSGDIGSKDGSMSKIKRDRMSIQLNGKAVVVDQALLRGAGGQLVAWSWYRIGEMYTSNDYLAKFHEALGVMGVVPAGSSRIVLSMPLKDSIDDTHAAMQDFLLVYGDSLDSKLNTAIVERRQ